MTAATIFSTLLNYGTQSLQNKNHAQVQPAAQGFQQEFQQLGQDLKTGNLAAAQTDLATLQQSGALPASIASAPLGNPIAQEFAQLSQDVKTGNLSAAQQDYSALQVQLQTHTVRHNGHHQYQSETSGTDPVSNLMGQLGQALQTGNLSSAQQAYSALQQDLQMLSSGGGPASSAAILPNSFSING